MSDKQLATLDLGSNSFHMIVVNILDDKHFQIVDRLREPVRLGAGLDAEGNLSAEAQQRALECLQRFGERIRHLPSESIAAVGTNTLRMANDSRDFLLRAERALGHPIAVISGVEEARLIYLGVSHSLEHEDSNSNRLVMDIGGGSTELIIGRGFEAQYLESLKMGCVSSTQIFFPNGRLDKNCWRKAVTAARLHLMPIAKHYRALGWSHATGASGTIKAVSKVLQQASVAPYGITLEGMYQIRERMIEAGTLERLKLPGLSVDRRPVFAGGLAILIATFEALGIETMQVSDWALREGLVYDRMQRFQQEDIRGKTVAALQQRFAIEVEHGQNVRSTLKLLHQACAKDWDLPAYSLELLLWAADLHEIGLIVSHSGYQKHSGYLIDNIDLPGFSTEEQHWLSTLVRTHRGKLSNKLYSALNIHIYGMALRMSVLLRLAVLLHRSRQDSVPAIVLLLAKGNCLELKFVEASLEEQRPLLFADLERERDFLRAVDIQLKYS